MPHNSRCALLGYDGTQDSANEGNVMGKGEKKNGDAQPKASAELAPRDKNSGKLDRAYYEQELLRLQIELVKLQEWVRARGLRVVVVFEGRDAAGKGGCIKRISEALNPRICRIVALPTPTDRERSQWYFQRYVEQLPGAGEIVLFDRSWYNRAGVERVMGFATEAEVEEFFRECPEFERMLCRSGIVLVKYWFSVSDEEQDRRFQDRLDNPLKRWKFSEMDLEGRDRWEEYSRAKDEMLKYTDTKESPWWVVDGDDKKRARLNCMSHLLGVIPYEDIMPDGMALPPRKAASKGYVRVPIDSQTFVPTRY
jgi:polyphosphate kinase